jgi:excisionase family DNA binding protein
MGSPDNSSSAPSGTKAKEPLAYGVSRTAKLLGCSDNTVRRMISSGQLRAVRLCGRVVVPVVAIEELLGVQRPSPSAHDLVKAFAALVGADE